MLQKMQKHLKDKKAFSLIEIIFSTAVIATLAVTTIPQAITFVDNALKEEQNANAYKILDNLTEQVRATNYDGITAVTKAPTTDTNFIYNITPTEQVDGKGLKMKNVLIQVCPSDAQDKKVDTDCLVTSVAKLNLAAGTMWNKISEYDGSFKAGTTAGEWIPSSATGLHQYLNNATLTTYMDGKFYIIGNIDTPGTNPRFWSAPKILVYDTQTDTWSDFPVSLQKSVLGGKVVNGSNGKIYVVGGKYENGFYIQTIDTISQTVSVSPAIMPFAYDVNYNKADHKAYPKTITSLENFLVAVYTDGLEEKVFVLPGTVMMATSPTESNDNYNYLIDWTWVPLSIIQDHYIYNTSSNTWTVREDTQIPSANPTSNLANRGYMVTSRWFVDTYGNADNTVTPVVDNNNNIYFLNNNTNSWGIVFKYNIATNTWDESWKSTSAPEYNRYKGANFINLKEDGYIYIPTIDNYSDSYLTKANISARTFSSATADLKMKGIFPEQNSFFPPSLYSSYNSYNPSAPGFNIPDGSRSRNALTIVREANDNMYALVLPDGKSYGATSTYQLTNFPNVTPGLGLRVYKYSKQPNEY